MSECICRARQVRMAEWSKAPDSRYRLGNIGPPGAGKKKIKRGKKGGEEGRKGDERRESFF